MGCHVWVALLVWAGAFRRSEIAIIVVIFPALSAGRAVAAIARAAGRGGAVDWNGRIGRGGWMALEAPIMKPWWLHWYSTSGECGERRQLLLHITASCTSREQFACQSTKLPEIGLSCLIPTRHEWNSLP